MVDMSATLIHHGHIRLLASAAQHGRVIVGLTSDTGIFRHKHYAPELSFDERCEVLLAIRYVDEVVETPWLITEAILDEHRIDLLVHGEDNQNPIDKARIMLLPRTRGVSSQELRLRSYQSLQSVQAHNETQNV